VGVGDLAARHDLLEGRGRIATGAERRRRCGVEGDLRGTAAVEGAVAGSRQSAGATAHDEDTGAAALGECRGDDEQVGPRPCDDRLLGA